MYGATCPNPHYADHMDEDGQTPRERMRDKCEKHEWSYSFRDYGDCFYVLRKCLNCTSTDEASGPELRWYPMGPMTMRDMSGK